MPIPPPFNVSPAAEERLSRVPILDGQEPGIDRALSYQAHKDGELTEEFNEEHYSIGFNPPEIWSSIPSAVKMTIAGREFWIYSETIESLRGKTLTLIEKEVGRGKCTGKTRKLLMAI